MFKSYSKLLLSAVAIFTVNKPHVLASHLPTFSVRFFSLSFNQLRQPCLLIPSFCTLTLARRVLAVVVFDRADVRIADEDFENEGPDEGNGDTVHSAHREATGRVRQGKFAIVRKRPAIRRTADRTRAEQIRVLIDDTLTCHG